MAIVEGVTISNPGRVVFPGAGLTKLDLARYIARFAPLMVPHVAGRPLTFLRCPGGLGEDCFFQKHWTGRLPDGLSTVLIEQRDGRRKPYVVVRDAVGLVTLVQWGIVEVHTWCARADDVDAPDRLIFDLDPGPDVPWANVRDSATAVRSLLRALGLESWLKTSGGKGLHVVVPIVRRSTWVEAAGFARTVAERLEAEAPDRFVARASKAARVGKVYIDWLRNARGATSVAPWSTRARPDAGVSLPLPWHQLARVESAGHATVATLSAGRRPRDPWKSMTGTRQAITKAMMRR